MRLRRLASTPYACVELRGVWLPGVVREVSESVAARLLEQHVADFEADEVGPRLSPEPPDLVALFGERIASIFEHEGVSLGWVQTASDDDLLALPGIGRGSLARIRTRLDGLKPQPQTPGL